MTGTTDDAPRKVSLAEVRDAVVALVDEYEETAGVSPEDDYDATPRVHPMAEGKYLLACVELLTAGVLSLPTLQRRARASLSRLQATDVGTGGLSAWGLGFSFQDLPADEPFTITTAIVLDALVAVEPHVTEQDAGLCARLREGAVRWLAALPRVDDDGATLPAYSPSLRLGAYNVAAYWAGALATALDATSPIVPEVVATAAAVLDRGVPQVGWPYDATSLRADLVHTCYIGVGLLKALPERADDVTRVVVPALFQFCGSPWTDRFDIRDLGEVLAGTGVRTARVTRVLGDNALVGFDQPARSWSMGEALVLLGQLMDRGPRSEFYRLQMRALADRVVTDYLPERRYRHSMHLAHGLAVVVREARTARKAE